MNRTAVTTDLAEPADQAVRARALDPARSFIVQAPAGAGKTELLTRRYLRLLTTVDAPEEILAITFTRKAAAEMRNRVIDALALGAVDAAPEEPHRRQTWELARSARAADARRGWQLESHPARMRIMTIDALNQSLARRLPVLSGLGAPIEIASDPGLLYREAVLRVVERLGTPGDDSDAIARLIAHLDNNLDAFERLLVPLLARREHWLDLGLLRLASPSLRQRLEQALNRAVAERLATVATAIPPDLHAALVSAAAGAANWLAEVDSGSPICACRGMTCLPAAATEALPLWQGLCELLLTGRGEWRKPGGVNVRLGFPSAAKARKAAFTDLLATISREPGLATRLHELRSLPDAHYPQPQWEVLEALLAVLRIAVTELDVVFSERGATDYAAVAIAARRALGPADAPTDLALRLDYGLRHVLVDEFQDTSRSQVELLRLLTAGWTRGDGRTLFCVGDPMQSIYRFRDAEVGLFLSIARKGLGDLDVEPLQLTVNFRSTVPLVNWVNAAFAAILPPRDDPTRGAVAHARSTARPDASETGTVMIHSFVGERAATRVAEARRVAVIAREAWENDPRASIAVLVASRTHLPAILAELRRAALPVRAVEIDPLAGRPVVQDLLALTRALNHQGDRTAWLAVLRAPWCGLSLADLHALCAGSRDAAISELLADDDHVARLSAMGRASVARVRPHLEVALLQRGRFGVRERVERTWNALGGPACVRQQSELQDAEVFLDRLESIERGGDLDDVHRIELVLGDLYGSATASEGQRAIEVMTIHKAKGLEFDVVILPALDRTPRSDDLPLLRWAELPFVDGTTSLLLAPIAERGADHDPVHAWLGALEREKSTHERARLLYVAATRAVRELHLLGGLNVEPDRPELPQLPGRGSFLALAWPYVEGEFRANARCVHEPRNDRRKGSTGLRVRYLPAAWEAPPAATSIELGSMSAPIEDAPLRPDFDWASEVIRHVGTVVHREIERIVRHGVAGIDRDPIEQRRGGYLTALAELGVPPAHRDAAADRVVAALGAMLQDERGRWLLAGHEVHRESQAELSLSGFFGDELVTGVIDRTFVTQDGERWIVDFKTSSHEGGARDAFLANEALRYSGQLARYARLMRAFEPDHRVRAALYFPLLRAWVEVDV